MNYPSGKPAVARPSWWTPAPPPNRLDVYVHIDVTQNADPRLGELLAAVQRIEGKVDNMNEVLQATLDKVTEQKTLTESLIALFQGLNASLGEFLAGKLSDENLAGAQAILQTASDTAQEVADALAANTPLASAAKKK